MLMKFFSFLLFAFCCFRVIGKLVCILYRLFEIWTQKSLKSEVGCGVVGGELRAESDWLGSTVVVGWWSSWSSLVSMSV